MIYLIFLFFSPIDFEIESDIDEDEVDEELKVPEFLSNATFDEKIKLLKFKRTHNQVF
jgi:hypothetical protein